MKNPPFKISTYTGRTAGRIVQRPDGIWEYHDHTGKLHSEHKHFQDARAARNQDRGWKRASHGGAMRVNN